MNLDDPVAIVSGVGLRIGDKPIYRNLSLTIPGRGCTVLLGPSGTGKSTLLRLLNGQLLRHPLVAFQGELRVVGLTEGFGCEASRPPIMVEQKADLLVSTVWASLVKDWPRRAVLTQAEQKLELSRILGDWGQSDLVPLWDETLVGLSKAVQVRIAIARVALIGAPLLMLDEPTANLRGESADGILDLIQRLKGQVAILVVTHHLGHARQLADHVLLIASGTLQEQAAADAFFVSPQSESGRAFLRSGSCPEQPMELEPSVGAAGDETEAELDVADANEAATRRSDDILSTVLTLGEADKGFAPDVLGATDLAAAALQAVRDPAEFEAPPWGSPVTTDAYPGAQDNDNEASGIALALSHFVETLTEDGDAGKLAPAQPSASVQGIQLATPTPNEGRLKVHPDTLGSSMGMLLRDSAPPAPRARELGPRGRGPRGFTWMLEDKLAGTPWPGIFVDVDEDLSALRDAGITHLFSLTETPFPPEVAAAWGLTCSSYSMPDMAAPDLTRADAICEWLDALIQAGHAVAVHCKAGLGRTGTILAMYWMWTQSGDVSHKTAIQWVRSRSAGMIQSDSQVHFLSQYACARLGDATSMATPS